MFEKEFYKITDYLKKENEIYSWYKDVLNGLNPRYKLDRPRPYDDASYYWANSFDNENWYIHFGNTYNLSKAELIVGTDNAINKLIELNKNIKSKIIHN